MKICGIIAEYNPFHNGHAYQMRQARARTGADAVLCVMSGHFTQRGEPAMFDKWMRAEAALRCGADVVAELPLMGALQSAEGFAACGVGLLEAMGADFLCFGSETGDVTLLQKAAALFAEEPDGYRVLLKDLLKRGEAYPYARLKAAAEVLRLPTESVQTLSSPNAILGTEYLKAIQQTGASIRPAVVERVGGGYGDPELKSGGFSSATALRRAIAREGFSPEVRASMPEEAARTLSEHLSRGFLPVTLRRFDGALLFILRRNGIEALRSLYEVSEGLEHRIYNAALCCADAESLLKSVKTKRYTHTRLSRILLYALLGVTRDAVEAFNRRGATHARILGVRNGRQDVLSEIAKRCRVPVVVDPGKRHQKLLYWEALASDIYALTQRERPYRDTRHDFTRMLMKI